MHRERSLIGASVIMKWKIQKHIGQKLVSHVLYNLPVSPTGLGSQLSPSFARDIQCKPTVENKAAEKNGASPCKNIKTHRVRGCLFLLYRTTTSS